MIATLRGKVLGVNDQSLIVDVNGVGFSVMVTPTVRGQAEIGSELFLNLKIKLRVSLGAMEVERENLYRITRQLSLLQKRSQALVLMHAK